MATGENASGGPKLAVPSSQAPSGQLSIFTPESVMDGGALAPIWTAGARKQLRRALLVRAPGL